MTSLIPAGTPLHEKLPPKQHHLQSQPQLQLRCNTSERYLAVDGLLENVVHCGDDLSIQRYRLSRPAGLARMTSGPYLDKRPPR